MLEFMLIVVLGPFFLAAIFKTLLYILTFGFITKVYVDDRREEREIRNAKLYKEADERTDNFCSALKYMADNKAPVYFNDSEWISKNGQIYQDGKSVNILEFSLFIPSDWSTTNTKGENINHG